MRRHSGAVPLERAVAMCERVCWHAVNQQFTTTSTCETIAGTMCSKQTEPAT